MQILKNDLSLQNIGSTASMKQNSSSKLKNIYANNGMGGTQNDKNALY